MEVEQTLEKEFSNQVDLQDDEGLSREVLYENVDFYWFNDTYIKYIILANC